MIEAGEPGRNPSSFDPHQTLLAILEAIHTPQSLHELMQNVLTVVRGVTGCEAAGIRLRDGYDFPYFEVHGFTAEFVELERSLCSRIVSRDQEPVLECMCGDVLQGRTDPSKPFFTAKGSFCSNYTTGLLASTTEAGGRSSARNRCNAWGYETVALVPLRCGGSTFGLLQVNDHRRDSLPPATLYFLEQLAAAISLGLSHQQSVEQLAHKSAQNELMLQDLQHRVRNSLQLVLSLLRLQERALSSSVEKAVLASAMRRIESVAWVHEHLYEAGAFERIDLAHYAGQLARRLQQALARESVSVRLELDGVSMTASAQDAVSVGLVLAELISNALRHAYPASAEGTITVALRRNGREIVAAVADDGVGMELCGGVPSRTGSGLQIVTLLVRHLGGTLQWSGPPGTRCELRFLLAPERGRPS